MSIRFVISAVLALALFVILGSFLWWGGDAPSPELRSSTSSPETVAESEPPAVESEPTTAGDTTPRSPAAEEVDPGTARFLGTVTCRGVPVAGAVVRAVSLAEVDRAMRELAAGLRGRPDSVKSRHWEGRVASLRSDAAATATDDEGRYEISGLTAGRFRVTVTSADHFPFEGAFRLGVDESQRRDIVLAEGASIHGTVVDPDGRAVSGASVALDLAEAAAASDSARSIRREQQLRDGRLDRWPVVQSTDSGGAFRFAGLDRLEVRLVARAPGFRDAVSSDVVPSDEPITLRLQPGASITGTLRPPRGIAPTRAQVFVLGEDEVAAAVADWDALRVRASSSSSDRVPARTVAIGPDQDGAFELRRARARLESGRRHRRRPPSVRFGGGRARVRKDDPARCVVPRGRAATRGASRRSQGAGDRRRHRARRAGGAWPGSLPHARASRAVRRRSVDRRPGAVCRVGSPVRCVRRRGVARRVRPGLAFVGRSRRKRAGRAHGEGADASGLRRAWRGFDTRRGGGGFRSSVAAKRDRLRPGRFNSRGSRAPSVPSRSGSSCRFRLQNERSIGT